MKRTPLRRGKALQRRAVNRAVRKPLPVRSAKRAGEAEERRDVVARVKARDGHRCRAPAALAASGVEAPLECSGRLDVHEVIRRSAWRAGYLVDDNCLTICRGHHDWIGANPTDAIDAGLALRSTAPRPPKGTP